MSYITSHKRETNYHHKKKSLHIRTILKNDNRKCWQGCKEIDLLYSMCEFVGRQSDTATPENSFAISEKQLNIYLLYIPAIILLSHSSINLYT